MKTYTILRRPEQLAAVPFEGESTLAALASDGSMWARVYGKDPSDGACRWHWTRIPDLPPIATRDSEEEAIPLRRIA